MGIEKLGGIKEVIKAFKAFPYTQLFIRINLSAADKKLLSKKGIRAELRLAGYYKFKRMKKGS